MESRIRCVGPRLQTLALRRLAVAAIILLALEAVGYGLAGPVATDGRLPRELAAPDAPADARVAVLVLGLALLASAPRVWRGGLPRPRVVLAAAGAWVVAAAALAVAALVVRWGSLIEPLVGGALAVTVVALRAAVSPAPATPRPSEHEYRTARGIIDSHGRDSLTPFVLRPDKALAFAAGGVLSYQVIGATAVISADPVAPDGAAGEVLAAFRAHARRRGWRIAVWGASPRHLDAYRRLGLRAICVGEEAFIDPSRFSLEGRAVRKLRQSVHRVGRRGWEIQVREGRDIDAALEREMEVLAGRWRHDHPRLHGFAMGMGAYAGELRPDDLYLLARSPEGELGAVMRFVPYGTNLSLDTMQRVGETPNGLNEALVVRALEEARDRGIPEVSLNYAGLAHLVRPQPDAPRLRGAVIRIVMGPLHRRFQMDRLVHFNDKFSPQWRRRYLVYESRSALPRAILRVLQAEGYLPQPRLHRPPQ